MATSVVAGGKIIAAKARNEKIPEGWALDESGRPTTDPAAVFGEAGWIGALLPIGGYKGYGLSLIFDLLCTALTGANFSTQINSMWDFSKSWNAGNVMMTIDIEKLVPVNLFKQRVDRLIGIIKNSRKAVGIAEILMPGEIEFREKEKRLKEGVPIDENVLRELNALAKIIH
jgi:LDH2 family malate/lactate/ureidoglycolate dehydrogenase